MAVWKPDFGEHEWVWDAICLIGSGSAWPEGNEDELRELAGLWRDVGDLIGEMLSDADGAMLEVLTEYGGGAGQELNDLWNELVAGSEAAFPMIYNASYDLADGVDAVALQVEYEKLVVLISVIIAIISIIVAVIMAFFTAGASTASIPVIIRSSQHVVMTAFRQLLTAAGRRVLREAIESALRQLTVRALGSLTRNAVTRLSTQLSWRWVGVQALRQIGLQVGQQLVTEIGAQAYQIYHGHREGWDTQGLAIAGLSAALAGPLSVVPYRMASNYGGWVPNLGREVAANVLADQGGSFLATGLLTGRWELPSATDLLGSAVFGTALSVAEGAGASLGARLAQMPDVTGTTVRVSGADDLAPATVSLAGLDGPPRIDRPNIDQLSSPSVTASPAAVDAGPPAGSRTATGPVLAGVATEAGPAPVASSTAAPATPAATGPAPATQSPSGPTPVAVVAAAPPTAGLSPGAPVGGTPTAGPPPTASPGPHPTAPAGSPPVTSAGPSTAGSPAATTGPSPASAGPSGPTVSTTPSGTGSTTPSGTGSTTPSGTGAPTPTGSSGSAGAPSGLPHQHTAPASSSAGPAATSPTHSAGGATQPGTGPQPSPAPHPRSGAQPGSAPHPGAAPHPGSAPSPGVPQSSGPHPGTGPHPTSSPAAAGPQPAQLGPTGRGPAAGPGPVPTSAVTTPAAPPATGPAAGPSPTPLVGDPTAVGSSPAPGSPPAAGRGAIWSALVGDDGGPSPTAVDAGRQPSGVAPAEPGSAPAADQSDVQRSAGTTANGTYAYEGSVLDLGQEKPQRDKLGRILTDVACSVADSTLATAKRQGHGSSRRPSMAGAMFVRESHNGETVYRVYSHTSMKSGGTGVQPAPHPLVNIVLDEIKDRLRQRGGREPGWHGSCAEVALVSDRIYELARQEDAPAFVGEGYRRDSADGESGADSSTGRRDRPAWLQAIAARMDKILPVPASATDQPTTSRPDSSDQPTAERPDSSDRPTTGRPDSSDQPTEGRPDSSQRRDDPPKLDAFTDHVIDRLRGSVVTTHRIGDRRVAGATYHHGTFTPPCATCGPLLKFFDIEHMGDWDVAQPPARSTSPTPADAGGRPTIPPAAVDDRSPLPAAVDDRPTGPTVGEGRPPRPVEAEGLPTGPVEPTRPYGVPQGLDYVHPKDVAHMEQVALRGPDGQPVVHPDPRKGEWLKAVNDGGVDVPGRANNCTDCLLSFAATWYGDPTVSAPRTETSGPEDGGLARLEAVLGRPLEFYGDVRGLNTIADQLRQAGPGSMAGITVNWRNAGAHAFAMVNVQGKVLIIDPQLGRVGLPAEWFGHIEHVFGAVLDPDGRPWTPPAAHTGPAAGSTTGASSVVAPLGEDTPESLDSLPVEPGAQPAVLDQSMYDYLHPAEVATAERVAKLPQFAGRTFKAPPSDPGYDWLDDLGRHYDAIGRPEVSRHFNWDTFRRSIDKHLLKHNHFTVIDVTGFTPQQVALVKSYLDVLPQTTDHGNTIIRIGFDVIDSS